MLAAILITIGIVACGKETVKQYLTFNAPDYFPPPAYNFADNPLTEDGFQLGRKLFYDPILSSNNTISCASCHIQTSAFTHHGHDVSHGIFNRLGTRNAPPVMNLAWSTSFMWDGGIADLDLQPVAPITDHVEMDNTMENVLASLNASDEYRTLFRKAFGSDSITTAYFLKALSQFMVMCISSNARYDSVQRGQATFTTAEQAGYTLFKQHCNTCHKEPLFTDYSFRNNGFTSFGKVDSGRYKVTLQQSDLYKFKVPTLRNVGHTATYMHNGLLYTLPAVLDFYSSQVQATQNLDPLLQQNGRLGFDLSAEDKANLLAFLNTLNDYSFLVDKRFSEP